MDGNGSLVNSVCRITKCKLVAFEKLFRVLTGTSVLKRSRVVGRASQTMRVVGNTMVGRDITNLREGVNSLNI